MFDIGWSEMLLIAIVAIVFIGPKELPGVLRTMGAWSRKARSLAREFQGTVEEMIRESELDDVRRQIRSLETMNVKAEMEKALDPSGEIKAQLHPSGFDPSIAPPPVPHVEGEAPKP